MHKLILTIATLTLAPTAFAQIPSNLSTLQGSTIIFNNSQNGQMLIEYQTCDYKNNCKAGEVVVGTGKQHNYIVLTSNLGRYVSILRVREKDVDNRVVAKVSFAPYGDGSCAGYDVNPIILDDMNGSPYILCHATSSMGRAELIDRQ